MIVTITGQDGSGKTTLLHNLLEVFAGQNAATMHLPVSSFVNEALTISGAGTPMGDTHTDRLIFALDNRLAHYKLHELLETHDIVFCQRGWMDSFIHGAVQGYSYEETARITRAGDLVSPICSIYLNCEPKTAFKRVKNDPFGDKFETPDYMTAQYAETKAFCAAIDEDKTLKKIFTEPRLYIDTTNLTTEETFEQALAFIKGCIADQATPRTQKEVA